jgi:diguanylate cyclase (GGDEF)-like protein
LGFFDETKLTKWVVILPIISVIITALVFLVTGIQTRKTTLEQDTLQKQIKILKANKIEAIKKVDSIASFLNSTELLQKQEVQEDVKNMVNLASSIVKYIYLENQNLSKEEILKKIKSKLRDIRFWDNTGYFFIYDTQGKCILLPTNPSLENTNLLSLQDAKKKYTIQDAINIVKKNSEGFLEWYWYKPNEKIMKKKVGFVKIFKPLDIYIGTARYKEDIIDKVKTRMVKLFEEDKEIFFIYDSKRNSIIKNNKDIKQEGISHIVLGSKIISEGYFINDSVSTSFNIYKKVTDGTLFIRYLKEFDWIIGVDTYNEEILNNLYKERKKLEEGFVEIIKNRILFSLVIILIVLLVTSFFSNKLKKILGLYQKNLMEEHKVTLKHQERLTHNLKHDYLTSLPNRILLTDRLEQFIKHSKRSNKKIAVMFVDIDRFKSINDSLGHDIGDLLLKEIAKRLKKSVRDSDTVARFGGDEFVILVDDVINIHDIIKVIDKVQQAIRKKIIVEKTEHDITLSIGISVFPNDGKSVQTLLKNADMAMYKAKNDGGDKYRFFMPQMNEDIQNQIKLEKALRVAVEKNEFVLYYQPLIEAKSSKIIGVEALIRWNHPIKGLIFPDEFIGIAEQSSVVLELGQWIVYESMRQMKEWKDKGYGLEKMSINIAVKQLEDENFETCMRKNLKETGCQANWIEIEIIERFAMKDIKKSIEILNEIRKMNIDIAIDDFGTGHSSLAYLKQLPITKLKIDRGFVNNILNSFEDKAIAESILALGSGLHLTVLAEGIETKEQRDFFAHGNCQQMQGYLFSKPLCAEEVEKLLQKGYIE